MRVSYLATLRSVLAQRGTADETPMTGATLARLVGPLATDEPFLARVAAATGAEARGWEVVLQAEQEAKALSAFVRDRGRAPKSIGDVRAYLDEASRKFLARLDARQGRRRPPLASPLEARYRTLVQALDAARPATPPAATAPRRTTAVPVDPEKLLRRALAARPKNGVL